MKQQKVDPGWAWTRKFNISAGVKVGETVHLSGNVALDGDGNLVGEGDAYAQSMQVFRNIEEALASAGASLGDVTKITTWLTDMSNYAAFSRARAETFPNGVASTAVCSPALVMPGLLVEIEAIAIIGSAPD